MTDYTKSPGKTLPLEELQKVYVAIAEEHGEKAYSTGWINKNGYSWIYNQVRVRYKIKWSDFRNKCGFDIKLKYSKSDLLLEDFIKEYKSISLGHNLFRCVSHKSKLTSSGNLSKKEKDRELLDF